MSDTTDTAEYLDELRAMLESHDSAILALRRAALEEKIAPQLPLPPIPAAPKITMGGDVSAAGAAGAVARQFTGGLAVVPCYVSGTTYVISIATKSVVAILGTEGTSYPFGVALTPAGEYGAYAWVTGHGDTPGPVYSLASFTRAGQVLPYGDGIAVSPDGAHAYCASGATLYEWDTATKLPQRFVTPGGGVWGVAATPNGEYLYLTSNATIKVVRLLDFTIVATIDLPSGGYGWDVAVTPDGAWVYVTDAGGAARVFVIRTSDNTVYTSVAVGAEPRSVAITPAGDYAWVACAGTESIQSIRVADNVAQSPINVLNNPEGIAVTPDGTEVWVACSGADMVVPVRASDGYVYAGIPVGDTPYRLAIEG